MAQRGRDKSSDECPLSGVKRALGRLQGQLCVISHTEPGVTVMISHRGRRCHHMQRRQFIALPGGAAACRRADV